MWKGEGQDFRDSLFLQKCDPVFWNQVLFLRNWVTFSGNWITFSGNQVTFYGNWVTFLKFLEFFLGNRVTFLRNWVTFFWDQHSSDPLLEFLVIISKRNSLAMVSCLIVQDWISDSSNLTKVIACHVCMTCMAAVTVSKISATLADSFLRIWLGNSVSH